MPGVKIELDFHHRRVVSRYTVAWVPRVVTASWRVRAASWPLGHSNNLIFRKN
jgi:hypothetical protein